MKRVLFCLSSILTALLGIGWIYVVLLFDHAPNGADFSNYLSLPVCLLFMLGFGIAVFFALLFFDQVYRKNISREISSLIHLHKETDLNKQTSAFKAIPDECRSNLLFHVQIRKDMQQVADFLADGKYKEADDMIAQADKSNEMQRSLSVLTVNLIHKQDEEQKRNWANTGMAKFSELLSHTELDLSEFCDRLLSELVRFNGYNQGAIFLVQKDGVSDNEYLNLQSCYAYERKKFIDKRIEKENGLPGQCWHEGEVIILNEVPGDFVKITSGLGEATPNHVMLVPMKYNGRVEGIIELASFSGFEQSEIEFIQKVSENIAAHIQSKKTSDEIKKLLKVSEQKTQQLLAQEEELRQNSEEIMAQREDLERKVEIQKKSIEKLQTSEDNVIINVTGRQRMLSQQMAFFSTMLYHGKTEVKPKLQHAVDLFDHSLTILENGGVFKGVDYDKEIQATSGNVKDILLKVKEIWIPIHESINTLMETDYSLPVISLSKENTYQCIKYIEDNIHVLLEATHKLTQAYVEKSFSWRDMIFDEIESLFLDEAHGKRDFDDTLKSIAMAELIPKE